MKRIFPILLITLVSCCSRNNEVSAQTKTTNGSGTTLSLSKIEISDDVVNTAVPTIKSSNSNDSQIYDLHGRKIDSLGKGQIYIQNGEKRVKQF